MQSAMEIGNVHFDPTIFLLFLSPFFPEKEDLASSSSFFYESGKRKKILSSLE